MSSKCFGNQWCSTTAIRKKNMIITFDSCARTPSSSETRIFWLQIVQCLFKGYFSLVALPGTIVHHHPVFGSSGDSVMMLKQPQVPSGFCQCRVMRRWKKIFDLVFLSLLQGEIVKNFSSPNCVKTNINFYFKTNILVYHLKYMANTFQMLFTHNYNASYENDTDNKHHVYKSPRVPTQHI